MDRVEILKGNYGYKRFTRDGYATVLESSDFYSQGELGKFRGIENEWPMFFAYQVIAAYFDKEVPFHLTLISPLLCAFLLVISFVDGKG